MNEKLEKIKAHVIKHKTVYVSVAVGVASAGITCLIMRGRHADMLSVSDGPEKVTVRPFSFNFFAKESGNIVTAIHRDGRGNPGYITRCLETGQLFTTQGEAARAFELSPSILSDHLSGKIENAGGFHFERLGVAS